jgi:hypothetical protein
VRDGLVDYVQHSGGCGSDDLTVPGPDDSGQLLPQATGCREVQLHGATRRHTQLRCPPPQQPDCIELSGPGPAPGRRGVGEQWQIVAEKLDRDVPDVATGAVGDIHQP